MCTISRCRNYYATQNAVVTINSTAGISALIHNKPLKVMGNALYDIKGLTYQGHLHQFWQADFKPDMKLFKKFRGVFIDEDAG